VTLAGLFNQNYMTVYEAPHVVFGKKCAYDR